jgi:bHLH factor
MSIEMADQADFDHSGLQEVANAVRNNSGADELLGNNNQKRKREVTDQDGSADASRRPGSKRSFQKNVNDPSDQSANAFMDAQHDGNAGVESLQEYSNLQDQNLDNQNGASEHANATSTAAAALGIYPTMTIPQPTGVQFQTQGTDGDGNQDSFMDTSQQNDSYMDNSTAQAGGRQGGSKPAVGSEEWHKVRKDNHKEGKPSI